MAVYAARHHVRDRHAFQEVPDQVVQGRPELCRRPVQPRPVAVRAGLLDRPENLANADVPGRPLQAIAASWAPGAHYHIAPPQHGEELFEIGQGDFLTLRHFGERNRTGSGIIGYIDESYDRVTTLRPDTHRMTAFVM